MPQVTVFLKVKTYLTLAKQAGKQRVSCSSILRKLTEEEYEGVQR